MRTKTETKRQAIIDFAAEVFREVGFERASMSEICRHVGGSKATIYNYFPSKEALFFEVMYQSHEASFHALHAMLDHNTTDVAESLRHYGTGLLSLLYSPTLMAVRRLMASAFDGGELGQNCYDRGPRRSMDEISSFIAAATQKGMLRPCNPTTATYHLRGLLESELIDSFIFQIPVDISPERIKEITHQAIDVFMAAYGPRAADTPSA